ncbi:hypothetical protein YA0058_24085 [Pseudomonas syringae]|uniref:hypothetical protein n=2 Tax=Pseudomonas syringae TaxID=317 RepID=UPI0018E62A85|nr:hypothetical protein [Pseudomonas syringae]MBI6768408.1 hypothetical protein [Pseudomonas syringae]
MSIQYDLEIKLHNGHIESLSQVNLDFEFPHGSGIRYFAHPLEAALMPRGIIHIGASKFSNWEIADEVTIGQRTYIVDNILTLPTSTENIISYSVISINP